MNPCCRDYWQKIKDEWQAMSSEHPIRKACANAARTYIGHGFNQTVGPRKVPALSVMPDTLANVVSTVKRSHVEPSCEMPPSAIVECRDAAVGESIWGDPFVCYGIWDIP